jgi:hypothetical protein
MYVSYVLTTRIVSVGFLRAPRIGPLTQSPLRCTHVRSVAFDMFDVAAAHSILVVRLPFGCSLIIRHRNTDVVDCVVETAFNTGL